MNLRDDFQTARRTGGKEWRLLAEAAGLLMVARLAVWFVPFRRLANHLGDVKAETPAADSDEQRAAAVSIGWAVRTLGRRLPWMSQCLVQAVAATWMLKRRCIPSTLYFGLAKDEDDREELKAHAWVRSGELVLIGAKQRHDFTVVATFASPGMDRKPDPTAPP